MLDDSSKADDIAPARRSWWSVALGVLLTAVAYKLPQWLAADAAVLLIPILPFSSNIRMFTLYLFIEVVTIGLIAAFLRIMGHSFADAGVGKFKLDFIWQALGGYAVYFVSIIAVLMIAQAVGLPLDEEQELGFSSPDSAETIFVFVMLGVLVPITEELLFRGFLYRVLRDKLSFLLTSLLVSLAFAVVHGQLVVGIDVFVLSMVVCYLREKSGSIWPGVIVHSLKNSVAFFILFIYNGS
jgi:membrane protease YdiL (CAAX protease family)